MSRPKGSKNKKTLQDEAQLGSQIEQQRIILQTLQEEEAALQAALAESRQNVKSKRREVLAAGRTLDRLTRKKAELDAAEIERAQRAELEAAVASLMNSGKSAEEILRMFKGK